MSEFALNRSEGFLSESRSRVQGPGAQVPNSRWHRCIFGVGKWCRSEFCIKSQPAWASAVPHNPLFPHNIFPQGRDKCQPGVETQTLAPGHPDVGAVRPLLDAAQKAGQREA